MLFHTELFQFGFVMISLAVCILFVMISITQESRDLSAVKFKEHTCALRETMDCNSFEPFQDFRLFKHRFTNRTLQALFFHACIHYHLDFLILTF